jgi:hypothetical protein
MNSRFDIKKNNNFKLVLPNRGHEYEIDGDYLEHKNVSYKINSNGYRGEDIDGVSDLMTLGCSFTFGVGLPEEKVWPSLLAEKMGMSLVNLASPGDSAMGQIRKAFDYFSIHGHPKVIVCLFPTLRIEIPIKPDRLFPKNMSKDNYDPIAKIEVRVNDSKYAKAPFDPCEILTPEVPFYYTHMMIRMLEQYCESHGIKLVWSVWEDFYKDVYRFVQAIDLNVYKNFCELSFSKWSRQIENGVLKEYKNHELSVTCHNEYQDDFFFHSASDTFHGIDQTHAGFHRNIHISEEFYDFIKKDLNV